MQSSRKAFPEDAPVENEPCRCKARLRYVSRMDRDSTVAERLTLAFDLDEVGEAMLRQRLRRERPERTEGEVDALVDAWRQRRPGAEDGDAEGTRIPWPRRP